MNTIRLTTKWWKEQRPFFDRLARWQNRLRRLSRISTYSHYSVGLRSVVAGRVVAYYRYRIRVSGYDTGSIAIHTYKFYKEHASANIIYFFNAHLPNINALSVSGFKECLRSPITSRPQLKILSTDTDEPGIEIMSLASLLRFGNSFEWICQYCIASTPGCSQRKLRYLSTSSIAWFSKTAWEKREEKRAVFTGAEHKGIFLSDLCRQQLPRAIVQ